MWFRLALTHHGPASLAALVGDEGHMFWRVSDIGRLLGKSNPSDYANHCKVPTRLGQEVVKGPLMKSTAKAKLCSTSDAWHLLVLEDMEKANLFKVALTEGTCSVFGDRLMATYAHCPMLVLGGEDGLIRDWIRLFKKRVLDSRSLKPDGAVMDDASQATIENGVPTESENEPTGSENVSEPSENVFDEHLSEPLEHLSDEDMPEPSAHTSDGSEDMPEPSEYTFVGLEDMAESSEHMPEPTENVSEPSENVSEPSENVSEPSENVSEPLENVSEPSEHMSGPSEHMTDVRSRVLNVTIDGTDRWTLKINDQEVLVPPYKKMVLSLETPGS